MRVFFFFLDLGLGVLGARGLRFRGLGARGLGVGGCKFTGVWGSWLSPSWEFEALGFGVVEFLEDFPVCTGKAILKFPTRDF